MANVKYIHFVFVAALILSSSCERLEISDVDDKGTEVVLTLSDPETVKGGTRSAEDGFFVEAEDFWFRVQTRAISEVTSLANQSVVWGAYTPSGTWSPTSSTADGSGTVRTGRYASASGTSSNTYYVTNSPSASNLSINSSYATLTVSGTGSTGTDIVAGYAISSSVNVQVSVGHVFARTGSFNLQVSTGVTVSNVTWTLKSHDSTTGTAGVYNIRSGNWTSVSSTLSERSVNSSSDLYVIPGTYDVKVSCTVTRNGSSQNITRTGTVMLEKGKVNNVTASLSVTNDYELIIAPSSAQLAVGYTRTYSATLRTWVVVNGVRTSSYTDSALANSQVTWSSSNTSSATISNSSGHQGEVTGVSAGSVTITGRYTPSGSAQISGTASLTVVSGGNNWDDSWNNGGEVPLT